MKNENIDGGKSFDWGKTSQEYAKYRDIYPEEFYHYILNKGLCTKGQEVLDIGTGTGVLPRNLYPYGAAFTGVDISENQIVQARALSEAAGMDIRFMCGPAEQMAFKEKSFDAVLACQCFTYFDHQVLVPEIHKILKDGGRFAILYMAWLPYEDVIAGQSEALVLKYSPLWSGCGEIRHFIEVPEVYGDYFELESQEIFDIKVPFTREAWNGRMRACRGIGASLSEAEADRFEREHQQLLERIAPEHFQILHYAAAAILKKR